MGKRLDMLDAEPSLISISSCPSHLPPIPS